jgi:uroporphyrinogen-III decarboxylase
MTRKARLWAAVRHKPVDRVPYATYNLHPYAGLDGAAPQHVKDPTYAELLDRVRARAGAFIKTGHGGVGEGLTRVKEGLIEQRIEGAGDARTRTSILHTPKGDLTRVTRVPENKPGMTVKPFVTCPEEMEKYMSIPYEAPVFNVANVRALYESAGDRALLCVGFAEPMYATANVLDFEDFCVRCITDLPLMLRWIDWAQERCLANLRLTVKACRGMDLLFHTGGPEVCTPPMMPPALFPKLVTPYLTQLNDVIHEAGFTAAVHCHGRVREVLPEIIRAGTDFLEPIEPPDQGNIGLAELMAQAAGHLCLMGHIQDQEFYTAPPGFMTRRVEEIAAVVRGRSGYIMSPTCTPFEFPCSETYRRNYAEWLDAAERILA